MRAIIVLLAGLVFVNQAHAVEFRFANDQWKTQDKLEHFIGGAGTTTISGFAVSIFHDDLMDNKTITTIAIANIAFWTLWEVKDGLVPYEKYGEIGGDGFSYKDLLWSAAGVVFVSGLNLLANR